MLLREPQWPKLFNSHSLPSWDRGQENEIARLEQSLVKHNTHSS